MDDIVHSCVLCGLTGEEMNRFKPSDNFTSWDLLGAGDSLCVACETIFKNQNYRRKSWSWSNKVTEFHKPKEMLAVMLDPPQPPFHLYITTSGQKQTFLKLFRKGPNMSRESFWLAEEDIGLLHVHYSMVKEFELFAREAFLKLGAKKWKLLQGPSVEDWKEKELCERIELMRGDPLWRLIVRLI